MVLFEICGLMVFYGDFQVLFGVDFVFEEGEMVVVIGVNGVGKLIFLCLIFGLLCNVFVQICYENVDIGVFFVFDVVCLGIVMVLEGWKFFFFFLVEENLFIG